ncbi:BNR repeat-containing protein [Arachidicoccus sp.]|uniref:BNR repeat-containing protein n=1 Tax=Arachidicoccus sp. TaxID=1872624 RepID=UPI003D1C96BF
MLEFIKRNKYWGPLFIALLFYTNANAQKLIPVAKGWAHNSVNTVIFRKNSLATFKHWQYIAYYDEQQNVVVGKRRINASKWNLHRTKFKGDASDAHRCICIEVDGDGYLHLAWDEHNSPLNYAKGIAPGSLEFGSKISMSGNLEKRVTYPEFYRLANGDLLFFYRNGQSGQGNLVINKYELKYKKWTQLYNNLIDGEGQRSAYWQTFVDAKGYIHISWVWRESADVASNHDLCYAVSKDGGITWQKSDGEKYDLPITKASAEYACHIPENSELINQTSMTADKSGIPFIATYWKDKGANVPQYHLIFLKNDKWVTQTLQLRHTNFSLSGMGTKQIPISRPQIICKEKQGKEIVGILYRDKERSNRVSLALNKDVFKGNNWQTKDIYHDNLKSWEPTFDVDLWKRKNRLDIFVQRVEQADGEGISTLEPQLIQVLEYRF